MISQKSYIENPYGAGWFSWELKFLGLFLGLISFSNLFFSNNTFALYVPTLSASVDHVNLQVNGNQVINSADKTTEIPLNLTVNTNNKTGYTATLNSETDETALVNNDSTNGAKINSISSAGLLGDFSNNTWGVKVGNGTNFLPIPKLTIPINVIQTTGKTNGNESNQLSIGMKLSDNLESGRYTNKLVFSILTNNYNQIAIMTEGRNFNNKLKFLEIISTNKIEHFKKSPVAPAASMNAVNIDDEESDYEIKLWLNPADKTAYYYAEPEKAYLNEDSSNIFSYMNGLTTLDLSNFDTSKVTNMTSMFNNTTSLTSLNLSNFNTSNVTSMSDMFKDMHGLTTLDLSSFDTSKVTSMMWMFSGMSNLTTLNLSNFNTSQVTYMHYMFSGMSNLITLNLSSFNTSKVTEMSGMFSNMSNLTSLDLSNFDTSNVIGMSNMFFLIDKDRLKDKLEKIYVDNDFDTSKLVSVNGMFYNRKKLRGGNGSYLTDPSMADKTWLRVDRPGVQGYFTRKS